MRTWTYQRMRKKRETLFLAQDGKCCYCCCEMVMPVRGLPPGTSHPPNMATLDHIIPKRDGGTNVIANLTLACFACNLARGRLIDRLVHMIESSRTESAC